jgi:hypothetical protein
MKISNHLTLRKETLRTMSVKTDLRAGKRGGGPTRGTITFNDACDGMGVCSSSGPDQQ